MAKEYNVVPVNVQNISDIKAPVEKVASTSANIYSLLNGKDYKNNINELVRETRKSSDRIEDLRTLLSGISKDFTILSKSLTDKTKTTSVSDREKEDSSFKKEAKDSLNKLVDSNKQILDALKSLSKELPELGFSSSMEASTTDAEFKEAQNKEEERSQRSLNKSDEMIRILREMRDVLNKPSSKDNVNEGRYERIKVERREEENKSQATARENAINALNNKVGTQSKLLSEIGDIGRKFFGVFTQSVRDIFNKWDSQTRLLKEQGMGSSNAVQLNRMTKRTMDATEELLGYNVSVDKAIKATNDMMAAGMNPRYIRENNKQLITGLEAVGIQLAPSTIREIGNSVYDASTVKELTGEWAALTSPDTENALDKAFVSRQLGSDQYKQMMATIMRTGEFSRADIEKEMQAALRTAVSSGFDNETAWNIALLQTQGRLGRGAATVIPQNVQSLIGAAQMSGSYTDLAHLAEGLSNTVKLYQTDLETRRRINQASPSLALGGDFTLFSNIQMNEGRTRRIASAEDIRAGQYEGFIPRIGKAIAGFLPAESIGGASQSLTGDSSFFTGIASGLVGKLGSFAGDAVQTGLLYKIEKNTSKGVEGTGNLIQGLFGGKPTGSGVPMGGALGKAGGIAAILGGIAVTGGLVYDAIDENLSAKDQSEELRKQINESVQNEEKLKEQLRSAQLSGDTRKIAEIKNLLDTAQQKTDQQIDMLEQSTDRESVSTSRGVGAGLGAAAGGIIAGALLSLTGVGASIGIPMMLAAIGGGIAAGAGLGAGAGHLGASMATSETSDQMAQKRDQARYLSRQGRLSEYANGGLITEEEVAIVGEGNKPEVVIPLTNSDKAKELMSQASQMSGVDSDVSDMMSKAVTEDSKVENTGNQRTIADLIIANAKSVIGAPYIPNSNYDKNPMKGMVCNQLVEYAYHKAGIPLKSRSVHYHVQSGDWAFTDTPQPGFAIFSNYGPKPKYNNISDYGHLGIVGYGNERIHASSKSGRVEHDMDLTRTLKYETNKKKYAKQYVFGYLKGVDYGNGTTLPDPISLNQSGEDVSSYTSFNQVPIISNVVSDTDSEADILTTYDPFIPSKRDDNSIKYREFIRKYTPKSDIVNNELVGDILLAKKSDTSDLFYDMLDSNNPLGVKSLDGTIAEYNSLQEGVDAFISKMEKSYDRLQQMDYMKQLEYFRNMSAITQQDYQRTKNIYDERLYQAIDRLRQSIDQSNMYSRSNYLNNIPTQAPSNRRYVS